MTRAIRFALLVLSAAAVAAPARSPAPRPASPAAVPSWTVDWIYGKEAAAIGRVPPFAWTSGGDVLFLAEDELPATIARVSAATGRRSNAVDAAAALATLRALGPAGAPETLPWPEALDPAGRTAIYVIGDDLYALDLAASRFERLTATDAREQLPRLSPDGSRVAFVRENDLWVLDLAAKKEIRLTSDGSPTILNGTLSWVYWEEVFSRGDTGYWWSPDSRSIAFLRTDDGPVDVSTFTDFDPAVPRQIVQRYPRTGRPNPTVRLGVVPASGGAAVWMDPASVPYEYLVGVAWLPDSRSVAVQAMNRPQTKLDVWRFDPSTAKTTLVLSDTDPALVYQKELVFADGGKTWIVSFEKDGHTHLFRYGADGARRNTITQGPWSVRGGRSYGAALGSAWVDDASGTVYFTAIEKSPLESHLYRVRPDGTGMARITKEDGTHRVTLSPDRRFYVDSFSTANTPPSLTLHDASGKTIATLSESRAAALAPLSPSRREFATIPTPDGFALPASVLEPPDFDPAKKYPVLVHVYGGPGSPIVQNRWDRESLFDQLLAARGYVVASFDPRSATGRSKTLEDAVVGKMMSDSELADLRTAVAWFKAQPWADPARFGIWGWSGGGSYTLLAMTRTTEFKAGISGAPVTDWHFYDTRFGEAWMKTPESNPAGYALTSALAHAKDLSGRLMLVFGTYDDNVHPQNEWAFANALIEAGKPFDLMVYPMQKHGFTSKAAIRHRAEKMLEFWKTYL
ncbi:MAG TPA: S9 family peptidase [Thermoanaerobaculia bacterium]|nr:S9 family peptidase [Thermoanaerobaculia bacterium]